MYKKLLYIVFAALLLGSYAPPAVAQYEKKDSFYYMRDDGIFSPEEKDAEAEYIKSKCENASLKPKYYSCACIAGAFRLKRDNEKLIPQDHLLRDIYNDPESKCANSATIAGHTYAFCQAYTKSFRAREENNEEYCKCVSNTVAKKFSEKPRLRSNYIKQIKLNAMSACNAPQIQIQP